MSREAARTARRLILPVRHEIIALAQTLVRIDTCATPPDGKEARAQRALYRFLKRNGVDVEIYDTGFLDDSDHPMVRHERNYAGRPNVIARLQGNGRGRSLLLNGHMDTVPPGMGSWRESPWSGSIRNGRLYGRGSFDMKGGLAAQFGVCLALKKAGIRLGGDLLCESVVDEEWAGGGGSLAARLRGDTADACAIGEVSGLSVFRATRGGHFFEITARAGDPAHYFSRAEVVGPAVPMGRLLGWIDCWAQKRKRIGTGEAYADFADPAPVQVLALEANRFEVHVPWSVPLEAKVRVYFQFLPGEDVEAAVRAIKKSFQEFCEDDPFFRVHCPRWRDIVNPPLSGHELPADHPWTRCLTAAASSVLRRPVAASAAEFPCDAFLMQNHFGIPTLIFGPAGSGAHNVNEYVTISSVLRTAEVLLAAALTWCGGTVTSVPHLSVK
jgi:acetylornithine deacetylase